MVHNHVPAMLPKQHRLGSYFSKTANTCEACKESIFPHKTNRRRHTIGQFERFRDMLTMENVNANSLVRNG